VLNKKVYNITIIIDHTVHEEWLIWVRAFIKAKALELQDAFSCKIMKLDTEYNPDGLTYALHFLVAGQGGLEAINTHFEIEMQEKMQEKFAQKYGSFSTSLSVIYEHDTK
jgi:hypothetical protein